MSNEPITRKEMFMAKAGGQNVNTPKPITREEMFLAKAGGQDVETPEPITRREKLLQGIIDNGGGGSGDTGGGTETLDALVDGSITEITSNATSVRTYAFMGVNTLKKAIFPMALSVGEQAFQACATLKEVTLSNIGSLASRTFYSDPALEKLDLGTRIGSIYDSFSNHSSLKTVIIRNTSGKPNLSSSTNFSSAPIANGTGYIYVPRALVDSYKSATNWATYADQFRALEDYTVDGTITGELDESKI